MQYAKQYIIQALNKEQLDLPDESQSQGMFETLFALYTAHQSGGVTGARKAFDTLQKLKPELSNQLPQMELLIHADELKNLSQPTYALADFAIYDGAFNLIIGPSGSRKSFIALHIAAQIALHHPVVYIAGEGLNGNAPRWEALKHHYKINEGEAQLYFYREALQVMDINQMIVFIQEIEKHHPKLVIIDTFARSAVGIEENSAREMSMFTNAVDKLRESMNCGIIVVHHTGKDGKIRGSSALYGAADSVLAVITEDDITSVYNDPDKGGKNKYNASMPTKHFALLPVTANGFDGAVLIPAEKILRTESDKLPENSRQILEVLDGFKSLKGQQIIATTGIAKSTVYRNLKKLINLGYVHQSEEDTEVFSITELGEKYLVNLVD